MLGKILNPLPSHTLSPSPLFPTPFFSLRFHNHFLKTSWKSVPNGGGTGGGGGLMVRVRAGFTRTPMETPGAYQLVDDETGEKFIVWGGADDDPIDSPIPSREILSWSPESENQGTKDLAFISKSNSLLEKEKGVGRSFGRLKVQKVNALLKKSSQLRRRITEDDDELPEKESPFDASLEEKAATRNKETVLGALKSVQRNMTESDDEDIGHPIHQTVSDKHCRSASVSKVKEDFKGWGKGGSSRDFDAETDLRQHRKFSSNSDFFSRKSFMEMGCSEFLIESLKKQFFMRPSHIQAMAFQPVMERNSCIIADQSGSGKTLAYLAPLVQRLRQEELEGLSRSSSKSPRAIILVPTAELATQSVEFIKQASNIIKKELGEKTIWCIRVVQVLHNCRLISRYGVPFRSMVVTGGFRQKTQLENLQEGVDVLIATPGRFMFLINEGFLELQNLRCVVLDEVDILCKDEDFDAALQRLISSSPVTTQYLFVTATLPIEIYNKLVEIFPDCKVIMGPGIHRTSPGLEEILVDCSGDEGTEKTPDTAFINKKSALLQIVEESPVPKTIVFCNKIETCWKVENVLKRYDRKGVNVRVLPFHAAVEQGSRLANMKEFSASPSKGASLFLVSTDRASRGIDFAGVNHVILFDYPRDPSEYVRRVGRTARGAGGKGKAFVFAVGKQVSLARRVMERNQKGHPLHDVPSAYELMS